MVYRNITLSQSVPHCSDIKNHQFLQAWGSTVVDEHMVGMWASIVRGGQVGDRVGEQMQPTSAAEIAFLLFYAVLQISSFSLLIQETSCHFLSALPTTVLTIFEIKSSIISPFNHFLLLPLNIPALLTVAAAVLTGIADLLLVSSWPSKSSLFSLSVPSSLSSLYLSGEKPYASVWKALEFSGLPDK